MSETLNVINEHITDMKGVRRGVSMERKSINESASDYSSTTHMDSQRLSYINGEETDDEEDIMPTRAEALAWTPDQVAEYLFTSGVEAAHCEVLRDEEFSGEVILGLEQETLQMGTLALGSIGRRLKTWHKIKALQDGVNGPARRNTAPYGSEHGSDTASRRTSRATSTSVPRISSLRDRPGSRQASRFSQQAFRPGPLDEIPPVSPISMQGSPSLGNPERRPSAASIRNIGHSRQNSSTAFGFAPLTNLMEDDAVNTPRSSVIDHKKSPSFDRNWTMGAAAPVVPNRPMSSGLDMSNAFLREEPAEIIAAPTNLDTERAYFSGGEAETRNRNLLRKRASGAHSHKSSYTEEHRLRTGTANHRHSRIGSVDSMREKPPSAAQKYYGMNGRRRTPSESSINPSSRPVPPAKDTPPKTMKLEGMPYPDSSSAKSPASLTPQNGTSEWPVANKSLSLSRFGGLRAISDAVTGHERSRLKTSADPSLSPSLKDSPLQSPSNAGTEGSTPSGDPSLDLGSPDLKAAGMMTLGTPRPKRRKNKKETSAYTRGLLPLSFAEQKDGADYYGWLRKKSSNLMTTWKWRLCILKHRRLSYYYSEEDTEEKGLIDISFHRVLPADNEKVTTLHAALTGASNAPTSPPGGSTPTTPDLDGKLMSSANDSTFIFKLVPPRAGLSRAVTFTKPTVHYFAAPNLTQGRLWMAALMKATIDRDDSIPITTTYQQKTISLNKARVMRHRPPALMGLDETPDDELVKTPASDRHGLNITGIVFDSKETNDEDSGVSGVAKTDMENGDVAQAENTETPVSDEKAIEANILPANVVPQNA